MNEIRVAAGLRELDNSCASQCKDEMVGREDVPTGMAFTEQAVAPHLGWAQPPPLPTYARKPARHHCSVG